MYRFPFRTGLLLMLFTLPPACAASFGAFQITPKGEQKINLETGLTELPGGGTATDARSGLTLKAGRMSFRSGETLSASGVTLTTRDGSTLRADSVRFDQRSGVLSASGHLNFRNAQISGLSADAVQIYSRTSAVVASGRVRAVKPALSAGRIVVLDGGKRVLLSGPYTLSSAGSSYANARPDSRLLLSADVTTGRPPAGLLKDFAPYGK